MEQREIGAESKASHLVNEFQNSFKYITATFHPSDNPGESPGKSSNLSWAARAASDRYSAESRGNVIITSIDGKPRFVSRQLDCFCVICASFIGMLIAYPISGAVHGLPSRIAECLHDRLTRDAVKVALLINVTEMQLVAAWTLTDRSLLRVPREAPACRLFYD